MGRRFLILVGLVVVIGGVFCWVSFGDVEGEGERVELVGEFCLVGSDEVLGGVVDELGLAKRWGCERGEAIWRVGYGMRVEERGDGVFCVKFVDGDEGVVREVLFGVLDRFGGLVMERGLVDDFELLEEKMLKRVEEIGVARRLLRAECVRMNMSYSGVYEVKDRAVPGSLLLRDSSKLNALAQRYESLKMVLSAINIAHVDMHLSVDFPHVVRLREVALGSGWFGVSGVAERLDEIILEREDELVDARNRIEAIQERVGGKRDGVFDREWLSAEGLDLYENLLLEHKQVKWGVERLKRRREDLLGILKRGVGAEVDDLGEVEEVGWFFGRRYRLEVLVVVRGGTVGID